MEIRRVVSEGSSWLVAPAQLPALLEVIDERQIPVEFSLDPGSGRVSLRVEAAQCRRCGPILQLEGAGGRVRIDLDRVAYARIVGHGQASRRRCGVELLGVDGTVLLTLTGPESGAGPSADIWHLVIEALLPAAGRMSSRGSPWALPTAAHRKGPFVARRAPAGDLHADARCTTDGSELRSAAAQRT